MDENFAYWSASFNEQENGSLRPSPLVPTIATDITDMLPIDMPYYHDRARCHRSFYFNPHGGPITHRSTRSKPDSPVYLWLRNILAFGFVSCYEPPFERWSIPDARNPLLILCSGINRLSIRLKLPIVPSYFALDVLISFNSRDTSASFPELFTRYLTL